MQIRRSFSLALGLTSLIGVTASADVLVHFDFEDAGVTGTAPNRVWEVTDKAGPDLTNVSVVEADDEWIESFNGSQGLYVDGGSGSGIDLGSGAGNELLTDFSTGLIIETTFRVAEGSNVATSSLPLVFRDQSFTLGVRSANAASDALHVAGGITSGSFRDVRSAEAIEIGKTYRVRFEFIPHDPDAGQTGQLLLELENLTDGETPTLATNSTTHSATDGMGNPVLLGYDDRLIGENRIFRYFKGHMDDVSIAVPEPASLALLGAGAVMVLGRRRR